MSMQPELDSFLDEWTTDTNDVKPTFNAIYAFLGGLDNVSLDFVARPGVSYSLRAKHAEQKNRTLFVLVDIIDDDPQARWLSVCFYDDLVMDPQEKGDVVPAGLMGEDARCFDLDEGSFEMQSYLLDRLREAAAMAPEKR
ncbi:hypothetical protein LJC46_05870 [Desulfovibrio sp. OttesenSCG-928-G15]|nr:hypothetical protein [Desulfovibrio sp. OttesenSCG-928-G15]